MGQNSGSQVLVGLNQQRLCIWYLVLTGSSSSPFRGSTTDQEQGTLGKYLVASQRNSLLLRKEKQELAPRIFPAPSDSQTKSSPPGVRGVRCCSRYQPICEERLGACCVTAGGACGGESHFHVMLAKGGGKGNRLIRREVEDQSQMRYTPPVTWVEPPITAPSQS